MASKKQLAKQQVPIPLGICLQKMRFMHQLTRYKNYILEYLFTCNFIVWQLTFSFYISTYLKFLLSYIDSSIDTGEILLSNSSRNRNNHSNNNLINELIEDIICRELKVIDERKENWSDKIIVNNNFKSNFHIIDQ